LIYYTNTPLTGADWKANFDKIIQWLTSGTYDIVVGNLTVSGTSTITGNTVISGDVTANNFYGNGSNLTGLNINNKNWIRNGIGQVGTGTDYTLVNGTYSFGNCNEWEGMASGTLVSAGVLSQTGGSNIGRTGYAIYFNGLTLTGSGVVHLRQRIYSEDAKKLIGKIVSFQSLVYQDIGSTLNYVVYYRKANAEDDFSGTTDISNSGNLPVLTATPTQLKYENISLGACGNGLEIEIVITTGAITNKYFLITELQLEVSPTCTDFEFRPYDYECLLCNVIAPNNASQDPGFSIIQNNDRVALNMVTGVGVTNSMETITNNGVGNILELHQAGVVANPYGIIDITSSVAQTGASGFLSIVANHALTSIPCIYIDNKGTNNNIVFNIPVARLSMIPSTSFMAIDDTIDYLIGTDGELQNRTNLGVNNFYSPLLGVPNGATITDMVIYFYENHASAGINLALIKNILTGDSPTTISTITQSGLTGGTGYHFYANSSIGAVIDLNLYRYSFLLTLDPGANVNDVRFLSVKIAYTITTPLP
jgi:hypothetical protein